MSRARLSPAIMSPEPQQQAQSIATMGAVSQRNMRALTSKTSERNLTKATSLRLKQQKEQREKAAAAAARKRGDGSDEEEPIVVRKEQLRAASQSSLAYAQSKILQAPSSDDDEDYVYGRKRLGKKGDEEQKSQDGQLETKLHWSTSKKEILIQAIRPEEIKWISKIGQGSTAQVHKAKWFGRDVAAKKYTYPKDKALKKLNRESSVHSQIPEHPLILAFVGACTIAEHPYLVCQLAVGCTLESVLRKYDKVPEGRNPWPVRQKKPQILRWMQGLTRAVQFLHSQDPLIVHRDINPSNVLLVEGMREIRLFDFGSAKVCKKDMLKEAGLPHRDDVYALAILLWEVCCGFPPPGGYSAHMVPDFVNDPLRPPIEWVVWEGMRPVIESTWRGEREFRLDCKELLEELARVEQTDEDIITDKQKLKALKASGGKSSQKGSKACVLS